MKQEISIRFYSKYIAFKSVYENRVELNKLALNDLKVKEYFEPIKKNWDLFDNVFKILEQIYLVRMALSDDEKSTINLVLPYFFKLKKFLEPFAGEDVRIKKLKEIINFNLDSKYTLDDIHYKSTLLTPAFKSLKFLPEHLREAIRNRTISQIKSDLNFFKSNNNQINQLEIRDHQNSISKSNSNNLVSLEEFEDLEDEEGEEFDELNYYLNKKPQNVDLFDFYHSIRDQCPNLFNYSMGVFSTPATSVIIEQKFSIVGLTLTRTRQCMLASSLNNNLIIKINHSLLE